LKCILYTFGIYLFLLNFLPFSILTIFVRRAKMVKMEKGKKFNKKRDSFSPFVLRRIDVYRVEGYALNV